MEGIYYSENFLFHTNLETFTLNSVATETPQSCLMSESLNDYQTFMEKLKECWLFSPTARVTTCPMFLDPSLEFCLTLMHLYYFLC